MSEEASVLLLPLCCGNGWPLLSFPASSPKLPLACAFLIYLWLLWWSLCNADPCHDSRCSGNFFVIISTGGCVFSSCHTISREPTRGRLVLQNDFPVIFRFTHWCDVKGEEGNAQWIWRKPLGRGITHLDIHKSLDLPSWSQWDDFYVQNEMKF